MILLASSKINDRDNILHVTVGNPDFEEGKAINEWLSLKGYSFYDSHYISQAVEVWEYRRQPPSLNPPTYTEIMEHY